MTTSTKISNGRPLSSNCYAEHLIGEESDENITA